MSFGVVSIELDSLAGKPFSVQQSFICKLGPAKISSNKVGEAQRCMSGRIVRVELNGLFIRTTCVIVGRTGLARIIIPSPKHIIVGVQALGRLLERPLSFDVLNLYRQF